MQADFLSMSGVDGQELMIIHLILQSEIMDMKEEMMNDALDDALGDEDDEEETYVMIFCFEA